MDLVGNQSNKKSPAEQTADGKFIANKGLYRFLKEKEASGLVSSEIFRQIENAELYTLTANDLAKTAKISLRAVQMHCYKMYKKGLAIKKNNGAGRLAWVFSTAAVLNFQNRTLPGRPLTHGTKKRLKQRLGLI